MGNGMPTENDFFDVVQQFYLETVGRSTLLSGRDLEFLAALRSNQIPAKVVCRGIDKANRALEDPPRSIHACQDWIETEIQDYQSRNTGKNKNEAPPEDNSCRMLETVRQIKERFERQEFQRAYQKVVEQLASDDDTGLDYEDISDMEKQLEEAFWGALSRDEKQHLETELADRIKSDDQLTQMSDDARREHKSAKRRKLLEENYGFVSLSQALIR
jgi:hypothetical protein